MKQWSKSIGGTYLKDFPSEKGDLILKFHESKHSFFKWDWFGIYHSEASISFVRKNLFFIPSSSRKKEGNGKKHIPNLGTIDGIECPCISTAKKKNTKIEIRICCTWPELDYVRGGNFVKTFYSFDTAWK